MSTSKKFPTRCVHEGEIKDTMYRELEDRNTELKEEKDDADEHDLDIVVRI